MYGIKRFLIDRVEYVLVYSVGNLDEKYFIKGDLREFDNLLISGEWSAVVDFACHRYCEDLSEAMRSQGRYLPPVKAEAGEQSIVSGFAKTHGAKLSKEDALANPPIWFYKGGSNALNLNNEDIIVPPSMNCLCEETEIVSIVKISNMGDPIFTGFSFANDVTDMGRIKANPLDLGGAKLFRTPVFPALFLDSIPDNVSGQVWIERGKEVAASLPIRTGGHHIKYETENIIKEHLRNPLMSLPGTVHYICLGTPDIMLNSGVNIQHEDTVVISFESHGVEIRSTFKFANN